MYIQQMAAEAGCPVVTEGRFWNFVILTVDIFPNRSTSVWHWRILQQSSICVRRLVHPIPNFSIYFPTSSW